MRSARWRATPAARANTPSPPLVVAPEQGKPDVGRTACEPTRYRATMTDRTVLIAGSSSGLGQAVIDAFRADGWRIVAPVRKVREQQDGVEYVPGVDLADPAAAGAALADAVGRASGDADRPLTAVVNLVG